MELKFTVVDGKVLASDGKWLTPKELLLRVKESIRKYSKFYSQFQWDCGAITLRNVEHGCGTPECIAGWCEHHAGTPLYKSDFGYGRVCDFIRADGQDTGEWPWLFDANWEQYPELTSMLYDPETKAEAAGLAIDAYIKEKGW